jgi:hypothetical protein
VAAGSTLFMLAVLWVLESSEPEKHKDFLLKITIKEPEKVKPAIEEVLRKNGIKCELRSASPEELTYVIDMPASRKTDKLTEALCAVGKGMAVEWADKKPAKNES